MIGHMSYEGLPSLDADVETEDEDYGGFGTEQEQYEDDDYEPSEQEIIEYCEWLGMDPEHDRQLTWIARDALKAPLPEYWRICYTEEREVYYFNVRTGESIWDHPMDGHYKQLFRHEKIKLEKKRKKMRLHPGSAPILHLQDFFSDLSEKDDKFEIPEYLLDPIDFRLYIDPVVLCTSGRTVSKHTIVNNKWRDPFSREYVENRKLIPNVDKRNEVIAWMNIALDKYFADFAIGHGCLEPLVRILPYVVDQECEASLKAQTACAKFIQKIFEAPADALSPPMSGSTSARRGRKPKTTPRTHPLTAPRPPSNRSVGGRYPTHAMNGMNALLAPPPPPPLPGTNLQDSFGQQEIVRLSEEDLQMLLGSLLTMSTAAAMETLYLLLDAVPAIRANRVFKGFSPEILNVLHISEGDLALISAAGAPKPSADGADDVASGSNATPRGEVGPGGVGLSGAVAPRRERNAERDRDRERRRSSCGVGVTRVTRNGDHIIALKWVVLLMEYPNQINVLEKLDWRTQLQIIVLIVNSIPEIAKERITIVCRLARALEGWPQVMSNCDDTVVRWLIEMTLQDTSPWNQILIIAELLTHAPCEGALECVREHKRTVVRALHAATAAEQPQGGAASAAQLGALLVYLDCCKPSDFEDNPILACSIAQDLLPRLTKQQWRPRHFEGVVVGIVSILKRFPDAAAQMVTRTRQREMGQVGQRPTEFLLRELSKKKKNMEDIRARLDAIENNERKCDSAHAAASWRLLAVRAELEMLLRRGKDDARTADSVDTLQRLAVRLQARKDGIRGQRVEHLILTLSTLRDVRLKPKSQERVGGAHILPTEARRPTERIAIPANDCAAKGRSHEPQTPSASSFPGPRRRRGKEAQGRAGEYDEVSLPALLPRSYATSAVARNDLIAVLPSHSSLPPIA